MQNSKNNNSDNKASAKTFGGALKSSFKNHRVLWGFGIAIAVLIILVSVLSAVISSQNFSVKMIDILMPRSIPVREDSLVQYEFYREINEDYIESDSKVADDNYINMFNYYYVDENGEKQYLDDGIYYYTDADGNQQKSLVNIGFMYSMGKRVSAIKQIAQIAAWVIAIAVVILLIVIWYIKDKKRNEQNKPKRIRKAGNKNQ